MIEFWSYFQQNNRYFRLKRGGKYCDVIKGTEQEATTARELELWQFEEKNELKFNIIK